MDDGRDTPPVRTGAAAGEVGLMVALSAFFAVSALMVTTLPSISLALQDEFGLSASQLGLLTSAYLLGYALIEFPAGFAAARYGGWVFIGSGTLLVLGSVLFAIGQSMPVFVAGRLLQGLGAGMIVVTASPVMARGIRPRRLGWAWGLTGSAWGVGTIVGLFLFPWIAQEFGFRAVPLSVAVYAAVLTVAVLIPRVVRAAPPTSGRSKTGAYLHDIGAMTRHRDVNLLALFNATSLAVNVAAIAWTPVFLHEMRGASVAVGAYVTAGIGFAQILANPVGAWSQTRVGARRVILWSQVALAGATLLVPLVPGVAPVLIVVALLGFFNMTYFPPIFSSIPVIVDLRLVGIAAAWISAVAMVSSVIFPWLFGAVLDAGLGYTAGYAILAAFALTGALATPFWRRPRRRR